MRIILASQSSNRQEIFKIVGIPVEIMPAPVDEKSVQEPDLEKRAVAIAQLKADWVDNQVTGEAVIIAGDGFNVVSGQVFEKPNDIEEARVMLHALSGNWTTFYSGLVMHNTRTQEVFRAVVSTTAWFRALSDAEIASYVTTVPVTQYAAAYSPMNTSALSFITKVEGSLSGFSHSMPMDIVVPKLKAWGAI